MTMPNCYLCGNKAEIISQKNRYDSIRKVYRCVNNKCRLIFLFPQLTEEEAGKFYSAEYRDLYDQGKTPIDFYISEFDETIERVKRLRKYLCKTKDFLEIGSSSGYFLYYVKPFVKSVTGVEPHVEFSRFSCSLGMNTLNKVESIMGKYDIIALFHSLEHFCRPIDLLKKLKKRLKKGGKIAIEVPNVDDAMIRHFKNKAYEEFYWQPAHNYYFNRNTLKACCKFADLEEVEPIKTIQRYDISNHLYWLAANKPGGSKVFSKIFPDSLNALYKSSLENSECGDTLWGVFR